MWGPTIIENSKITLKGTHLKCDWTSQTGALVTCLLPGS